MVIMFRVVLMASLFTLGCTAYRTQPPNKRPSGPEAHYNPSGAVAQYDPAATPSTATDAEIETEDSGTSYQGVRAEADLAEEVVRHRAAYRRALVELRDFYHKQGYLTKRGWAQFELDRLDSTKPYRYVMEAEVTRKPMKATDSIPGADALYQRGMELLREGGYGRPVLIYKEAHMTEAAETFRTLIQEYPSSDKIDDAAFHLGEIHRLFYKDQKLLAAKWYERAFEWDERTPYPARYRAATLYDKNLRNKYRALELYRLALKEETQFPMFVRTAQSRVEKLGRPVQLRESR